MIQYSDEDIKRAIEANKDDLLAKLLEENQRIADENTHLRRELCDTRRHSDYEPINVLSMDEPSGFDGTPTEMYVWNVPDYPHIKTVVALYNNKWVAVDPDMTASVWNHAAYLPLKRCTTESDCTPDPEKQVLTTNAIALKILDVLRDIIDGDVDYWFHPESPDQFQEELDTVKLGAVQSRDSIGLDSLDLIDFRIHLEDAFGIDWSDDALDKFIAEKTTVSDISNACVSDVVKFLASTLQ